MWEARADDLLLVVFVFDGSRLPLGSLRSLLLVRHRSLLLDQIDIVFNGADLGPLFHVHLLHVLSGVEFTLMLVDHL